MKSITIKQISSLEKVFLHKEPTQLLQPGELMGLKGERINFQLSWKGEFEQGKRPNWCYATLLVKGALAAHTTLYDVKMVPVTYPVTSCYDENYLSVEPGLYPDLLEPLHKNAVHIVSNSWITVWVSVDIPAGFEAGEFALDFSLQKDKDTEILAETQVSVKVLNHALPPQKLVHTQWFHADCLANYYETTVFSDMHWQIMENFLSTYKAFGINMVLTPIFTPPLDTEIGGERTTVQLIDVSVAGDTYQFGFEKLEKWVAMCRRVGIQYFEMSHLFSQWGAEKAVKVLATQNGETKQIFGWNTSATSPEYKGFLRAFLPCLLEELQKLGIQNHTYFHISDEPELKHLAQYRAAKAQVEDLLHGYPIIDAMSDYSFYQEGVIRKPIPSNDCIQPFIDGGVQNLWTYYCVGQGVGVSNRFIAMPSANNRILGTQLYKFNIEGFLHWGFNFYNSVFSRYSINPFVDLSSGYGFPAGDSFLVYPGEKGQPMLSIRIMVLHQAIQDMRMFTLLESKIGREQVIRLIDETAGQPVLFNQYPKSADYLVTLREKALELLNEKI